MIINTEEVNIGREIERRANLALRKHKEISFLDIIIEFCQENNVDPTFVAKHLSKPIIEKLESEAKQLNLLPKGNTLPI
jgi:hypothetical protein